MKSIIIWSLGLIAAVVCGIYLLAINAPVYLLGAVFFLAMTLLFGVMESVCEHTRLGSWLSELIERMWGR